MLWAIGDLVLPRVGPVGMINTHMGVICAVSAPNASVLWQDGRYESAIPLVDLDGGAYRCLVSFTPAIVALLGTRVVSVQPDGQQTSEIGIVTGGYTAEDVLGNTNEIIKCVISPGVGVGWFFTDVNAVRRIS